MKCNVCKGTAFSPTPHIDVFGLGASLVQCDGCGIKFYEWVGDPMVPHYDFYNSLGYDKIVKRDMETGTGFDPPKATKEEYFAVREDLALAFLEGAVRHRDGKVILNLFEAGCSWGFFLEVAKSCGARYVAGCDMSKCACSLAKKRKLNVRHSTFLDTLIPKKKMGKFHALIMHDFIEHTETPGSDLDKAWEMLSQDGILVVKTFVDEFHDGKGLDLTTKSPKGIEASGYFDPISHLYHFESGVLFSILGRKGFEVVEVDERDAGMGQISVFAKKAKKKQWMRPAK